MDAKKISAKIFYIDFIFSELKYWTLFSYTQIHSHQLMHTNKSAWRWAEGNQTSFLGSWRDFTSNPKGLKVQMPLTRVLKTYTD